MLGFPFVIEPCQASNEIPILSQISETLWKLLKANVCVLTKIIKVTVNAVNKTSVRKDESSIAHSSIRELVKCLNS